MCPVNLSSSQDTERSLAECMREKQFRNLFFGVEKLATEGCQMSSEADIFETMAWDQDIIRGKIKQMSDYNLNKQSGQKEVECPGHMR